jgi:hypothetical protein
MEAIFLQRSHSLLTYLNESTYQNTNPDFTYLSQFTGSLFLQNRSDPILVPFNLQTAQFLLWEIFFGNPDDFHSWVNHQLKLPNRDPSGSPRSHCHLAAEYMVGASQEALQRRGGQVCPLER